MSKTVTNLVHVFSMCNRIYLGKDRLKTVLQELCFAVPTGFALQVARRDLAKNGETRARIAGPE